MLKAFLFSGLMARAAGWGSSSSGTNYALYGNTLERDWMYDAKGISIKVEGCLWAYWQDKDEEESGCLEENSEDGTTYWYQMSNCRRAQVVWSVYASDSSSSPSCSSSNFKESVCLEFAGFVVIDDIYLLAIADKFFLLEIIQFVTTAGIAEFIYYLTQYDANNPFGNEDSYNGDYPMCENGIGMTCASDGSFALEYFSDSYCMTPSGSTYDQLQTLNSNMKTYTNCQNVYQYGDQYGNVLVPYLMSISYPCTSLVSGLCVDSEAAETRQALAGSNGVFSTHVKSSTGRQTWLTKLKYVAGGLLLLASFVMFTGILFTNRRRRRALMQRKYRQARRSGDDRSRRSSRSKSKGRERDSSRKSSSRRSSRSRDARDKEKSGVFT